VAPGGRLAGRGVRTFTKRPVPVEAVRFDGHNHDEIRGWQYPHVRQVGHPSVWFHPLDEMPVRVQNRFGDDGRVVAVVYDYLHKTWVGVKAGQWVLRGTEGEFYPCADDGTGEAPLNYQDSQPSLKTCDCTLTPVVVVTRASGDEVVLRVTCLACARQADLTVQPGVAPRVTLVP